MYKYFKKSLVFCDGRPLLSLRLSTGSDGPNMSFAIPVYGSLAVSLAWFLLTSAVVSGCILTKAVKYLTVVSNVTLLLSKTCIFLKKHHVN